MIRIGYLRYGYLAQRISPGRNAGLQGDILRAGHIKLNHGLFRYETGLILDVVATPAHLTAEVESTKVMIGRVEERFDITPERLIADTAYGEVLEACMRQPMIFLDLLSQHC